MKVPLIFAAMLLVASPALAQWDGLNPPADPRTNAQGYPTSHPPHDPPPLKRFADDETRLWQARVSGKTDFIKKLMSEDATFVSFAPAKNRQQWIADLASGACQWKSYKLDNFALKVTSPSAVSVSYHAEQDASCSGKSLPPSVEVVATYRMRDEEWRSIYYEEKPATQSASQAPTR